MECLLCSFRVRDLLRNSEVLNEKSLMAFVDGTDVFGLVIKKTTLVTV